MCVTELSLEMSGKGKMNTDASLYEVADKDKSSVEIPNNDYAVMTMTTTNRENIYSKPATSAAETHGSNDGKGASTKRLICIILVIVSVIATMALIAGCFVAVFLEIASLKSERAPQDQTPLSQLMANDSSIMLHLMFMINAMVLNVLMSKYDQMAS